MTTTPADLDALYHDVLLPPEGRRLLDEMRSGQPVRSVGGGLFNMSGRHASKTGKVLQHESWKLEGAYLWSLEMQDEVIDILDQPVRVRLACNGDFHKRRHPYTPDYFVARFVMEAGHRRLRLFFVECKHWDDMVALARRDPQRYRQENGRWIDASATAYFGSLGFEHEIVTERDMSANVVENAKRLRAWKGSSARVPETLQRAAVEWFGQNPNGSIREALDRVSGLKDSHVYSLVADGMLFGDLASALLHSHDRMRLCARREHVVFHRRIAEQGLAVSEVRIEPFQPLKFSDGSVWEILAVADESLDLRHVESGRFRSLARCDLLERIQNGSISSAVDASAFAPRSLQQRSDRAWLNALALQREVLPYVPAGVDAYGNRPPRRVRRWLKRYLENGLEGLLRTSGQHKGGHVVDPRAWAIIGEVLTEHFTQHPAPSATSSLREYLRKCDDENVEPASETTFRNLIRMGAGSWHSAYLRHGVKFANAEEGGYMGGVDLPRDGSFALARVHVDHKLLNLEAADVHGESLGKCWLTVAIDAFSHKVIGWVLLFDSPSAKTLMLLLRDIHRRIGQFPQIMIVDNGPEFHSSAFEIATGRLKVGIDWRPPYNPRFGGLIEHFFGQLIQQLVQEMAGNTVELRNVRAADGKLRERKNPPTFPFRDLYLTLDGFFEGHGSWRQDTIDGTPNDVFAATRPPISVVIARDDVIFLTTPSAGIYKVGRQGVKAKKVRYNCPAFRSPGARGSSADCRPDMFDISICYVRLNGQRHTAKSETFRRYPERFSGQELAAASIEVRRAIGRRHFKEIDLARYMEAVRTRQATLQAKRQLAQREVLAEQGVLATEEVPALPAPRGPIQLRELAPYTPKAATHLRAT